LVDLTAQPEEVKQAVDQSIKDQISHKDVGQVGSKYLKFCGKFELNKLSDQAAQIAKWLSATYTGEEL
jgi:S-ribosylhomocysteine lyase LuxS involved in autoinducer biosynthesis